jgi:hypothetical protein
MLGDSGDMGQLPQLNASDDDREEEYRIFAE